MKRCYVWFSLTLLLGIWVVSANAQDTIPPPLMMYRTFGGVIFEYTKDTTVFPVSPKQVLEIMKDDPLAYAEFKKARSNYSLAGVMGFVGGSIIAIPLVTAIAGGEPEWGLAAGGAAIVIASIPFNRAFKRHAQGAIDAYNKKHTAFLPRTEYFFTGLGARIVIKF